jgi:ferritin-like protein
VAEPKIVVEHREHLWYLLAEAAQVEHLIMCQYLYASFSLKAGPEDGLTAEQAAAVARWREMLTGIAIEEMLHLALVFNVMTAIGAAPPLSRPNFPRRSDDLPGGVQFRLLPFGTDSLTHFLYLERPEGMERMDAREFVPTIPPREPIEPGEAISRAQDFGTVGHLYRGIEQGLAALAGRFGERGLFVGPRRTQATPELFRWPQLVAVHDLASATAAINEIIEQGEGARGDWRPAHYGRFLGIWEEYAKLRGADPAFEPAFPVIPAFTRQPYDITEPQPLLTDPLTRAIAEVFNLGYEVLLQILNRFFTHTDETDEQLHVLVGAAFGLMAGVLRPLGQTLPRLAAGPEHPGRTAGPTFEMYYQFGNFVPWREPAWALLSERATILATRSAEAADLPGAPAAVNDAATAAAGLTARLLAHVPEELRHPQ